MKSAIRTLGMSGLSLAWAEVKWTFLIGQKIPTSPFFSLARKGPTFSFSKEALFPCHLHAA
jgi:hypothetical protein